MLLRNAIRSDLQPLAVIVLVDLAALFVFNNLIINILLRPNRLDCRPTDKSLEDLEFVTLFLDSIRDTTSLVFILFGDIIYIP